MAKQKRIAKRDIETYAHTGKERVNNPPVGLVTPDTDRDAGKKTYAYDPHLDPQLQWAGKAEHTSFEVPTISLHVHEQIDPRTIVEAVRKRNGAEPQMSLFAAPEENPPIRQAIEFYKHRHNWTNRLIAGDSLLVMNSLLEKEGLGGQVQMVYIDPPYGISYKSNFQPFSGNRSVKDGKDEDLTSEPEMLRAFRDTWQLGIHSYLTYLRDRFLLARDLLSQTGSIFIQISDENMHLVRNLLDEVFGTNNFISQIYFRKKTMPLGASFIEHMGDYLLWFAKDKESAKQTYRQLYKEADVQGDFHWKWYELPDGSRHRMSDEELNDHSRLPKNARVFRLVSMWPPTFDSKGVFSVDFRKKKWLPPEGACYPTNPEGINRLIKANRLESEGDYLRYVLYLDESLPKLTAAWTDTIGARNQQYVIETNPEVVSRCVLMATDPGQLVLDITCGGGTTAFVAEQWGRRWITCDTSRVAISLAKKRLMTTMFPFYKLAHQDEGISSGFKLREVDKASLSTVANNEPPERISLYDRPLIDSGKVRVTGPFTVEAVPAPAVQPLDEIVDEQPADNSVARKGQTLRQADWRDELFKTGIRGKAGQHISFARLEPMPGTRWLHAEGETRPDSAGADRIRDGGTAENPERVVVSFGPDHAPMEQRQIALAIEEAQTLVPKPTIIIFAAFQFDPEASKDIDETNWPGVTLLKAQMNADLLTDDLKKKRASNESFWLIGQPDVELEQVSDGEDKGKFRVSVRGFDYYNTKTGNVESGGKDRIAMWMLDPDYDGRSLFPRQVFFPMAGDEDGWAKLAKNLKAEIDTDLIEAYRGTISLPFKAGENKRIAVKIIDDRGIESLKIIEVE